MFQTTNQTMYLDGGFLKWGYPKSSHFSKIFHYKPSIWGAVNTCRNGMYLPIEIDSHRGGIKDVPNHLAEANPFRNNGTLWNIQHKKGCRFATNPYISILYPTIIGFCFIIRATAPPTVPQEELACGGRKIPIEEGGETKAKASPLISFKSI